MTHAFACISTALLHSKSKVRCVSVTSLCSLTLLKCSLAFQALLEKSRQPGCATIEELSQEVAHRLSRAWDTKGSHGAECSHITNSVGPGKRPIL